MIIHHLFKYNLLSNKLVLLNNSKYDGSFWKSIDKYITVKCCNYAQAHVLTIIDSNTNKIKGYLEYPVYSMMEIVNDRLYHVKSDQCLMGCQIYKCYNMDVYKLNT